MNLFQSMVEIFKTKICFLLVWNVFFALNILEKNTVNGNNCKSEKYQVRTLKLLHEEIIADAIMSDEMSISTSRFEASDVILRPDGQIMYVVLDNTFQIGALCTNLNSSAVNCKNRLLDWPDESMAKLESQFEGIAYNSLQDTYYVVQESIPTLKDKKEYQPNIFEISIEKNESNVDIEIIESCRVDMKFQSDGKGFEGLEFVISQRQEKSYLLGLCEANKCASSIPDKISNVDVGHGHLIVLERVAATHKNPCRWTVVDKIKLPSSIDFIDYSAISIYRRDLSIFPTYVAITSQENSQVWIGLIEEIDLSPFFKISSLDKDVSYNTPRMIKSSGDCSIQYCNIEGVAWLNKNQLILVSDKSKDDQEKICKEKDQSFHYMTFPENVID